MAFLADPGVPRPTLSAPFVVVSFAAVLATIVLLQGSLAGRQRPLSLDTAVCEQQTFLTRSHFFLTLH
jgi:hypothetical protein